MKTKVYGYLTLLLIIQAVTTTESSGSTPHGIRYYLNSENGSDSSDGQSPSSAWESLEKLNSQIFGPGDTISISRSTEYYGQIEFKGNGTEQRPIVVNTYGNGAKPVINGCGKKEYTLLLENCEYWEIRDLEITNLGDSRKAGRRGVLIRASIPADLHHIHLTGLSIHHVNGSLIKSEGGGSAIMIQSGNGNLKSRFIDLKIEGCHIFDCERNGINFSGASSRESWYPSLGVVIKGNLLERIPGDGIVPIACDGALIVENIMQDSPDILPPGEAAAGIWPWGSDNTMIAYNEVSGHKAKWDGQGFDADYNCVNTTFRYNYSHDNYGGFFLICNDGSTLGKSWNIGTENVIIEHNISINDGIRPYATKSGWISPSFHITGPVKNVIIRQNHIIMPRKPSHKTDSTAIHMNNWGGKWPSDVEISDNVFILNGSFSVKKGEAGDVRISGNEIRENISENLLPDTDGLSLLKEILDRLEYVRSIGENTIPDR